MHREKTVPLGLHQLRTTFVQLPQALPDLVANRGDLTGDLGECSERGVEFVLSLLVAELSAQEARVQPLDERAVHRAVRPGDLADLDDLPVHPLDLGRDLTRLLLR